MTWGFTQRLGQIALSEAWDKGIDEAKFGYYKALLD
jgi:hypothetical protein